MTVPATARNSAERPRDAATLIILRRESGKARILMGKRHQRHKFMAGKFVFPGGGIDKNDLSITPVGDLDRTTLDKLMIEIRRGAGERRARALALAAIRETFEEVGLIVGRRESATPAAVAGSSWNDFLATGHRPDLSGLRFFARAITPPHRPRRFDSRFFVVDAAHVVNIDAPVAIANDELLVPRWFTFAEAFKLELPSITRDILQRLQAAVLSGRTPAPDDPVSFQFMRGKSWHCECI